LKTRPNGAYFNAYAGGGPGRGALRPEIGALARTSVFAPEGGAEQSPGSLTLGNERPPTEP